MENNISENEHENLDEMKIKNLWLYLSVSGANSYM